METKKKKIKWWMLPLFIIAGAVSAVFFTAIGFAVWAELSGSNKVEYTKDNVVFEEIKTIKAPKNSSMVSLVYVSTENIKVINKDYIPRGLMTMLEIYAIENSIYGKLSHFFFYRSKEDAANWANLSMIDVFNSATESEYFVHLIMQADREIINADD